MARILHAGEWYEQIASEALYEEEYERIIVSAADHLFPSHYLIPFKMAVYSDDAAAKADFALVHRTYREWWIVEAEMSHHSFGSHVAPQVATLSRATYGEDSAEHLIRLEPRLNAGRMHSVIKGQHPGVLVIVNAPVPTWARDLKPYGALVTVLEIFRSRHNHHLYRLNGEQPPERATVSSECVVELARFLRILAPGILPVEHGGHLAIAFRGGVTPWVRTDLQDRVYLSCAKPVSLDPRVRYELVIGEEGSLTLTEIK